jgi:peptidoglycan/LPS O-acetylase OafA/YrhL
VLALVLVLVLPPLLVHVGVLATMPMLVLALLLVLSMVALLYYYAAHPVAGMVDPGGLVALMYMPLVVTLAIGVGVLPTLLSTRLLVYGGQISFSLYMIHEPVHTAWNWTVQQYAIVMEKPVAKLAVVGLIGAAIGAAILLYHLVEEPSRRWMRRMVDFREINADTETTARADSADNGEKVFGTRVQLWEGARAARPVQPSVPTGR